MTVKYYEHPKRLHSRAILTDYTIRVDTSADSIVYDLIDRANDEHYDAGSQPVTVKDVDWNDLIAYLKPLVGVEGNDPLIAENVWYQLRTFGMALAEQVPITSIVPVTVTNDQMFWGLEVVGNVHHLTASVVVSE